MNASRQAPTPPPPPRARRRVGDAAVLAAQLQPAAQRVVDGVVGRLEAEDEHGARPVAGAAALRLERVDQAHVGRVQARTARAPGRPRRPSRKPAKRTAREARCSGRGCTRIHASVITPSVPSLPSSMPVGRRARAAARQAAALPRARRRERAHGLHEVVDVGPQRREVAAGPGGDPAAQRGELEGLREEPQRQLVGAELLLEHRSGGPGLDAGRARDGVDLEHPVESRQVERDTPSKRAGTRGATPPTTLVPPP